MTIIDPLQPIDELLLQEITTKSLATLNGQLGFLFF